MLDFMVIGTESHHGHQLSRRRRHAVRSVMASAHVGEGYFGRVGQMSRKGPFSYSLTSMVDCGDSDFIRCNQTQWDGLETLPRCQLGSYSWQHYQSADWIIMVIHLVLKQRHYPWSLFPSMLYLIVIGEGRALGYYLLLMVLS